MTPKKRNKSDLLDLTDEIARGAQPPDSDVVGQAFLPATAPCHFERSRESVNNSSGERQAASLFVSAACRDADFNLAPALMSQ